MRRPTEFELVRAVEAGEWVVHYQPQVCLRGGHIIGVEALLRWQHPQLGLLPPSAFLSTLEASPLALDVGWWVLNQATRQMGVWHDIGLGALRVAVNLFSSQLWSGALAHRVTGALAASRLEPDLLELEITETASLRYDGRSLEELRYLRDTGVRIAVDDFGTGHGSMTTLKHYPLTTLKIDRGFVRNVLTDPRDTAITRALVTLGLELGLDITAEGIETSGQEAMLRSLGCTTGQGRRYGQPGAAALVRDMVAARNIAVL